MRENKEKIDIIIPIYNGINFLPRLFESVLKNSDMDFRIIAIDDASPDENVWELLQKIVKNNPDKEIIIKKNENNLGFVKTVNKAVGLAKNHFVLLNTDVEVPEGWLSRLMHPIFNFENIASVTPFTNSGSIASFPCIAQDNDIFEGLTVDQIDKFFQYVDMKDDYFEVPTGVGFCMALNKKLVNEIGMFDEVAFGKGYGEENDWCQRAIGHGYKNVIVPNLFVYHKHGGSFASEEKRRLCEENLVKLTKRYPGYQKDVAEFIEKDSLKEIRDFLILLISANSDSANKVVIFFDHELGGGANLYRENFITKSLGENRRILLITYDIKSKEFHLSYFYDKFAIRYGINKLEDISDLIKFFEVERIVFSEIVSYLSPLETIEYAMHLKDEKECELEVLVHDYFCVCPNVVLLNRSGRACEPTDLEGCKNCILKSDNELLRFVPIEERSIEIWRREWKNFLLKADVIVCFSKSSKDILLGFYPILSKKKISIVPHIIQPIKAPLMNHRKRRKNLIIGVLGGINHIKGSAIIEDMLKIIEKDGMNVEIIVIGEFLGKMKSNKLTVTGRYERENVNQLISKYKIDVFFIPSIVPETFSYTTEEIIQMGMPLAVFDLGAPAERVVRYKHGLIVPKIDAQVALEYILKLSKNYENL